MQDSGDRLGGFSEFLCLLPHLRVQRSANAPHRWASDNKALSSSHVIIIIIIFSGNRGAGATEQSCKGWQREGCR